MEKRMIIENDKAKIQAVIEELDEKKNEALKTTWKKVNKYGSSFISCIPMTVQRLWLHLFDPSPRNLR